ncbi:hypothetical protein [Pararobbsia silviterrae]|uniref:hypothetical protein n=1 Tax=Pararobbsia silviterrae TaxID=1792498 RepID=UPI001314E9E4|nr:hypothetical protein [Pararobbsia silviterrae]
MRELTYARRDASDDEKAIAREQAMQARQATLKFTVWGAIGLGIGFGLIILAQYLH